MSVVYAVVTTQVVLTVPVCLMEPTGQVTAAVFQIIIKDMSVMIVQARQMVKL